MCDPELASVFSTDIYPEGSLSENPSARKDNLQVMEQLDGRAHKGASQPAHTPVMLDALADMTWWQDHASREGIPIYQESIS